MSHSIGLAANSRHLSLCVPQLHRRALAAHCPAPEVHPFLLGLDCQCQGQLPRHQNQHVQAAEHESFHNLYADREKARPKKQNYIVILEPHTSHLLRIAEARALTGVCHGSVFYAARKRNAGLAAML